MRRKTLIVLTLVAVMLISSFLPIISVFAEEAGSTDSEERVEMSFNAKLYKGLKAYFIEKGYDARYYDTDRIIAMYQNVIDSVEEISVKEKGIDDLTGIENFKNVKRLILSANYLSENSNLEVIQGLENLEYLDLSSNNIKDATAIESVVIDLLEKDPDSVNLSSQTAKIVIDVEVDAEEQETRKTYQLPQILQLAGIAKKGEIQNRGFLKADWFKTFGSLASSRNLTGVAPYIVASTIPNPVLADDNSFDIMVGYESVSAYEPYEGLIKLEIQIKDSIPDAYTINPASQNILKDSVFTIFYVVHLEDTDGIIIQDKNLYYAIKEQLTKNQEVNTDLISHKYGTTADGEIYYDVCDYTYDPATRVAILKDSAGTELYRISEFNKNGGESIIEVKTGAAYVPTTERVRYEAIDVTEADDAGNVVTKRKIKVPHINTDARNLYVDAYDEAQAFSITDLDLVNKITSLILNDKRIYNLSGLEGFVGLKSNLNISYNYIRTFATIYLLQMHKEARNSALQSTFSAKKSAMSSTKSKVTSAYNKAKTAKKSIEDAIKQIEKDLPKLAAITDKSSSEYANAKKAVEDKILNVLGDGTDEHPGLVHELDVALNDPNNGLNVNLGELYYRLGIMYEVYNKEYRLTSILTPDLNYQTEEDFIAYKDKNKTLSGAKELAKAEAGRITTFEAANALSELEKDLIVEAFGLTLSPDDAHPVSSALNKLVARYEELNVPRTTWGAMNEKFVEIGLYSATANYCLLERMNNDTGASECYAEKFLDQLIEDYTYEDIDTQLAEDIFHLVKGEPVGAHPVYTGALYSIFADYRALEIEYTDGTNTAKHGVCKGKYDKVDAVKYTVTKGTHAELGTTEYPKSITMYDVIDSKNSTSELYLFQQLMNLANKFTAVDETSLYVNLPNLKRLDVRNNEIETLGPVYFATTNDDGETETVAKTIDTLTQLKELLAGHNFVTGDISCVDWTKLTALRKLDLSYNFIRDIKPLEVLVNLRYLDASDNLLGGSFNIYTRQMLNLKDLKLAGNKFTDINQILNDYEMLSGGDFTRYFAREDTLNLDLSRQELEINFDAPIAYNAAHNVVEVELPPLFAQLEHIDATRTAFGTTSSKGSISARGGVAYIPVNEIGDYEGVVTVIAANGYPEEVETSIGINSKCTIRYSVRQMGVTAVRINEDFVTSVARGETQKFTATILGENVEDTGVTWKVEGNTSTGTAISENGLLVVGTNETAETIKIIATSVVDKRKEATKTIYVVDPEVAKIVTSVTVTAEKLQYEPGTTLQFTAKVDGLNVTDDDQAVTWELTGNTSVYSKISETGLLTVGINETAPTLLITAKPIIDPEKFGSAVVTPKRDEDPTDKRVTGINIVSDKTTVKVGGIANLSATVEGINLTEEDQAVTWSIIGNNHSATTVSEEGVLTVNAAETATQVAVVATSVTDKTVTGSKTINITKEGSDEDPEPTDPAAKKVTGVAITSDKTTVKVGETANLSATVSGTNLTADDQKVTWTLTGNSNSNTKITSAGVLTVAAEETSAELLVTATSVTDTKVKGTKIIRVQKNDTPSETPTLGYKVSDDGSEILGISPSTKITDFKTKLLKEAGYTVEVKRAGRTVADDAFVATSDIVVISKNGTIVDSYELVVKGDVNGDGVADALDSSLIKAYRAKLEELSGAYLEAADINGDGEVTITDVRLLLYHRAKVDGYIL